MLEIGDSFRVNLYRPSYKALHQSGVSKSEPESIPETAPKSVLKLARIGANKGGYWEVRDK